MMVRMMLNRLRFYILAWVLTFAMALPVFAEDVSFEAALDADRVAIGSAAQLTLTVHGTQDIAQVTLPAIDGFDVRFVGPSTQIKVVNGEYSSTKSFNYMLVPRKEGKFTIPSIEVTIKGQSYLSRPIVVDVVPASVAAAPAPAGAAGQSTGTDPSILNDQQAIAERVMMVLLMPASQSYVNEEIPIAVKLYVRELPIQDISFPQIPQEGFILSEFSRPKQYQEPVNGKTFEVVEFNAHLTATRDGALTLGPAVITGNLLIKSNVRRNPFGNSVFDDDFFAGFFNSYQKKPVTITSRPITFTVKPLPQEGKPGDFSGGVGRFTFDASAAPLKVKAGDPVTLKMSVAGTGDLKTVKMPVFKDVHFKIYDPQIKESDGQKSLEQVIVPLNEGQSEIPALSFSYFDTSTGQYATVTRGPFAVEILPTEKGQEFQAVGFSERPVSLLKESLGADIVFVKDHSGILLKKQGWFARNAILLAIFVIYMNIWGALLGLYIYRRKMADDPGFARRSAALRIARGAMKELKGQIREGASKDFYTTLFSIFTQYLEKRLSIPPGGADLASVETALAVKGIDNTKIALLKELFELSERARFASASVGVDDMQRSFFDLEEILDEIERRVK